MNELIQSSFDYAALPVDAALNARAAAERIKLRLKRTVEDIIEIGRELTAVKPSLEGRFDAWFETETGLDRQMSYKFMGATEKFGSGAYNNYTSLSPTVIYLLSAPSTPDSVIDKAIEKAESGEKVTVADVKDWKAEVDIEKRRAEEWRQQALQSRKENIVLQHEMTKIKSAEKPEPEIKAPADYESTKAKAAALEQELTKIKKEQAKLVDEQVRAKMRGYQDELNEIEKKKKSIEAIVARKQAYLDSLSSEVKRVETHREVINGSRLELIGLAAFLNDLEPMNDPDTIKRWLALADMHEEAMKTIRLVFAHSRPELTLIREDAA